MVALSQGGAGADQVPVFKAELSLVKVLQARCRHNGAAMGDRRILIKQRTLPEFTDTYCIREGSTCHLACLEMIQPSSPLRARF